ncbi:hypothetical protein RJ639_001639 [Escallonia herrerae]|uniref:Uncharacterized protein n=1 Tax=Escallonia herrerae TaxID=1293975 RepID=A0AA88XAL2_9ASTE|nr:hypothetical protein RJ639_001639 [Escallonia herrerae]
MTKERIVELLEEFPFPPPFSAWVFALQEPANYGTDLETSVNDGQIKSGYRILMHPFAVAFFNHYKMAPSQLVPHGWRKLVGLIYLVRTSGYPVTIHDFMRLYLKVCFIKNVANSVGWYYFHDRVKVIKEGPKSNKEMAGKGEGAKGDFLGLLQKASKGERNKGTGEGSSPILKRPRALTPLVPPLVVEDLPIEKDPIFCPRWTIKRGNLGMPNLHASAQHLAHGAYCYSNQMQDRFTMVIDVARNAETDKRAAEGKSDKLDKEVKNIKREYRSSC